MSEDKEKQKDQPLDDKKKKSQEMLNALNAAQQEFNGQEGPDPTRYGDWEKGGRCTDF